MTWTLNKLEIEDDMQIEEIMKNLKEKESKRRLNLLSKIISTNVIIPLEKIDIQTIPIKYIETLLRNLISLKGKICGLEISRLTCDRCVKCFDCRTEYKSKRKITKVMEKLIEKLISLIMKK